MSMDMKTFAADVELKPAAPGKFKALVATFGVVDKGNDVCVQGAFTRSLARWRTSGRKIPLLWNHDQSDPDNIIGFCNPHDSQETDVGLVVTGALNLARPRAAVVYDALKDGVLSEWSFACRVVDARPRRNGGRDLWELDLIEVSSVLMGKGDTETLLVASAPVVSTLNVDEVLAPFRARLNVAQQRVARRRHVSA